MKGFKVNIKKSRMRQACQTHSYQGKTFQRQKKKKRTKGGSLPSASVYAHTQTNLRQTLPTFSRWTGERRRLLQVLFLDYHQTKTLNNADNFFYFFTRGKSLSTRLGTKLRERQVCPCNTYNQSTIGLRFKTAIPTKWRSWCVGDSRHMVDWQLKAFRCQQSFKKNEGWAAKIITFS